MYNLIEKVIKIQEERKRLRVIVYFLILINLFFIIYYFKKNNIESFEHFLKFITKRFKP